MPAHLTAEQRACNTEGAITIQLLYNPYPQSKVFGHVKCINRSGFIGRDSAVPCILHLLIKFLLPLWTMSLGN